MAEEKKEKKDEKKDEKKKHAHGGHGIKESHHIYHDDGSMSHHYVHEKGPEHDIKHATGADQGLDGMHDSLQDHLGTPNPGEAEADAGQSGMPEAQAAGAAGAGAGAPAAAPAGPAGM
jgi:hypothetical protein